jgi:hypothetical protein
LWGQIGATTVVKVVQLNYALIGLSIITFRTARPQQSLWTKGKAARRSHAGLTCTRRLLLLRLRRPGLGHRIKEGHNCAHDTPD